MQRNIVDPTQLASRQNQEAEAEDAVRVGIVKELAVKDGRRIDELCWHRHLHHHRCSHLLPCLPRTCLLPTRLTMNTEQLQEMYGLEWIDYIEYLEQ